MFIKYDLEIFDDWIVEDILDILEWSQEMILLFVFTHFQLRLRCFKEKWQHDTDTCRHACAQKHHIYVCMNSHNHEDQQAHTPKTEAIQ